MDGYGICPICGSEVIMRERRKDGNDKCEKGHYYPSKDTIKEFSEKAPPGWRGTVAAMKKHPELSGRGKNPYALAWYMKNKGDEAHYKDQDKPVKKPRFKEWLENRDK